MPDPADAIYERVLVLRCQAGDETAFAELIVRYQPRLRYYLRKMMGDAEAAEDALQETWFDVYRGLSRLAEANAFRTWLYRIARSRAAREFRRPRFSCRSLDSDDLAERETEDEPLDAESIARLHAAIDELPPEHRETLVLRYIESMSYEEIAQVTGSPLGTVRSRLHYAKHALRRRLMRNEAHD